MVCYPRGKEDKYFDIPQGITTIGKRAFYFIRPLVTITIPDSVIRIEESAFISCKNLRQATLPAELEKLGSFSFLDTSVKEFSLGAKLTDIGISPFPLGIDISIQIDQNNSRYIFDGYCLIDNQEKEIIRFARKDTTKYSIPDGIVTIGERAFCLSSLQSVTIPTSIEIIGNYAFAASRYLDNVIIPDSVKTIGAHAFEDVKCKAYTIPATVEFFNNDSFDDNVTLNVFHNTYAEQRAKEIGLYITYADESNDKSDKSEDTSWLNE